MNTLGHMAWDLKDSLDKCVEDGIEVVGGLVGLAG